MTLKQVTFNMEHMCQEYLGGTWVAQSVKQPTVDLGSGYDLMACDFEPRIGSVLTAWDPLSLSLSLSLSPLSQNQ